MNERRCLSALCLHPSDTAHPSAPLPSTHLSHCRPNMVNNNPAGHNGYDNGKGTLLSASSLMFIFSQIAPVPSEKVLVEALRQYSRESLPLERRLVRLREELGYKIGQARLWITPCGDLTF